ncbi:MAG: ankyrin repeat domain-containing protein [Alphaproteobacteria bacterium]|nr:ankyrin repeat domain-containing protein [Alphaproteobacteria bacterium]
MEGRTAIHLAAAAANTGAVHALLARGAPADVRSDAGETPLDLALRDVRGQALLPLVPTVVALVAGGATFSSMARSHLTSARDAFLADTSAFSPTVRDQLEEALRTLCDLAGVALRPRKHDGVARIEVQGGPVERQFAACGTTSCPSSVSPPRSRARPCGSWAT